MCRTRRESSASVPPAFAAVMALALCLAAAPTRAETRGYVISWFATATNVGDFRENCPSTRTAAGSI